MPTLAAGSGSWRCWHPTAELQRNEKVLLWLRSASVLVADWTGKPCLFIAIPGWCSDQTTTASTAWRATALSSAVLPVPPPSRDRGNQAGAAACSRLVFSRLTDVVEIPVMRATLRSGIPAFRASLAR